MWLIGEKNKGFSFVELMVTVAILCTGLILIIQGFIISAGALNTAQNYISAAQFLEEKMQQLEAVAKRDNGIKADNSDGKFYSAEREFSWELTMSDIEKIGDLQLNKELNEIRLKAEWQERNRPNDLTLFTYLKNKKNE